MSDPARCRRCSGPLQPQYVLGHWRFRCPEDRCERYRQHRREQQKQSALRIERGPNDGNRPTVEQLQHHYLHPDGIGFKRAVAEARDLLDGGASTETAAEHIGFTVRELLVALNGMCVKGRAA